MNESYTIEEKKQIVAKLFRFISAPERIIRPKELAYISHVAASFGLSEEELHSIKNSAQHIELEIPKDEKDRMSIFYYLLFLSRANGRISPKQEAYLVSEGLALGINPFLVLDLIAVLRKNERQSVPPSQMLDQIKKYLN